MAHSSEAYTYKGYWINWSHGAIFGSTITLSTRYGGLLTAFLAIYVTLAGAASWSIMSYILHQCRAKQEMQDAMHHQQQLIFRNTTSPAEAAWQFVQLAFHWRKCAKKPLLRSLPIGLLALLNLVLFGIASIFSSEVTRSSGNETLIRSPNCGAWTTDSDFKDVMSPGGVAYRSKLLNDALAASEYATACYNNSTDILRCNQFITQQIPWNVNQNASCPFASNLCIFGPASAYEMDTGPIDSQLVLGINAPASARITTRKLTTCSPIRTKGYTQLWNVTDPTLRTYGNTYIKLYFGEISGVTNFTHAYNLNMELMNTDYVLT